MPGSILLSLPKTPSMCASGLLLPTKNAKAPVRDGDFSAMWNVHTTGISKHCGVFEN